MSYIKSTGLDTRASVLPRTSHPLDIRAAVDTVEDLYKASTWVVDVDGVKKAYLYNGMLVTIKNPGQGKEPGIFVLQNYVPQDNFAPMGGILDDNDDNWLADKDGTKYWRSLLTNSERVRENEWIIFTGKYGFLADDPSQTFKYWNRDNTDQNIYNKIVTELSGENLQGLTFKYAEERKYQRVTIEDVDGKFVRYIYGDLSGAISHKKFTFIAGDESNETSDVITTFDGTEEGQLCFSGRGSITAGKSELANVINLGLAWKPLDLAPATLNITYNIGRTQLAEGISIGEAVAAFGSYTYNVGTGYTFKKFISQESLSNPVYDEYGESSYYTPDMDVYGVVLNSTTLTASDGVTSMTFIKGSNLTAAADPDAKPYNIAAYLFKRDANGNETYIAEGYSKNFINIDYSQVYSAGDEMSFDFSYYPGSGKEKSGVTVPNQYIVKFVKYGDTDDTSVAAPIPFDELSDPEFVPVRMSANFEQSDGIWVVFGMEGQLYNYTPLLTVYKSVSNFGASDGDNVFSCSTIPVKYTKLFNTNAGVGVGVYWLLSVSRDGIQIVNNEKVCGLSEDSNIPISPRSYINLISGSTYDITMTLYYEYTVGLPFNLPDALA